MPSRYYGTKNRLSSRAPKLSAKAKANLRKQSGVYGKHLAPKPTSLPSYPIDDDEEATRIHVVKTLKTPLAVPEICNAIAQTRLDRANSWAPSGTVVATFEPSGNVRDVNVSSLAGDVTVADCLVQAFRKAKIAPFSGHVVAVSKSFRV